MKKLRFIGLLVAVALLAFGLAVACSSVTPKDDDPFLKVYTGTSSSGQPVEITISSSSIARAVTEPQTGHNYLAKVNNAVTSEGKIRREAAGVIVFIPNDKSKPEFSGSWNNNILSVTNLPGPGGEALTVTAQDNAGGAGSGGGAGGGGGGGSGGGGGGGTTPPAVVDPFKLPSLDFNVSLPSPDVVAVPAIGGNVDQTGISSTVNWGVGTVWGATVLSGSGASATFRPETVYKARFAIQATPAAYSFDPAIVVTVNGKAVTVSDKSATAMTFEVEFPKTTKAVTAIEIVSEPAANKWVYVNGDTIDLTGLVVKLTYDTTAETVALADFANKGISTTLNPSTVPPEFTNRTKASVDTHNGKKIDISAGNLSAVTTVGTLSVGKASLNIRGDTYSVTIGDVPFTASGVGNTIDIAAELDEKLFKNIPTTGVGSRTYSLVAAPAGDTTSAVTSAGLLTADSTGSFRISLAIDGTGTLYAGTVQPVTATLIVNPGEVIFVTPIESDRTIAWTSSSTAITVNAGNLAVTYANKLGDTLSITTTAANGLGALASANPTVAQVSPAVGTYTTPPNLLVTTVGRFNVNYTVGAGTLYNAKTDGFELIITPIKISAVTFTEGTAPAAGAAVSTATLTFATTTPGASLATAGTPTWSVANFGITGSTATYTVVLTAVANYTFTDFVVGGVTATGNYTAKSATVGSNGSTVTVVLTATVP
jgi:hypothetical protein